MGHPILAAALAATTTLLLASCGSDGSGGSKFITVDGQKVTAEHLDAAVDGLCTSGRQAAAADLAGAKATFFDRSHEMIHVIARALETPDRAQAARLLEAKQRVEADLDGTGTTTPGLKEDLRSLIAVTRSGLDSLGIATPACTS